MRFVSVVWKLAVFASLVLGAGSAYVLSRGVMGSLTDATPGKAAGPASVDGLLSGLADSMDQVANGAGVSSGSPLAQGAAQLRSIQRGIGGTQKGFDKVSGALDGVLGGGSRPQSAEGKSAAPGLKELGLLEANGALAPSDPALHDQKPHDQKPHSQGPQIQVPHHEANAQPANGTVTHRPTRVE